MSEKKILYQCKSNHSRFDDERNAPMYCDDKVAWGGVGYYFWDSFIELGHFWGVKKKKSNYLIAKAEIDFSNKCFDLHNNPEHMKTVSTAKNEIYSRQKKSNSEPVTLCTIITLLKDKGILDNYEALRFLGKNSINPKTSKEFTSLLSVSTDPLKKQQTVDLCPPIQLCLFKSNSLNLRNYKIVFDSRNNTKYKRSS